MTSGPTRDWPIVSVIIPHYRDLHGLDRCLAALGRQSYPADRIEIVVADNDAAGDLLAVEARIGGRAHLLAVEQRGAGPARNGGVAASRGEILAFIDADCVAHGDWLAEGVAALDRGDLIGGRIEVLVQDPDDPTPTEAFEAVFAFDNERYVRRLGFTVTANLFCRRDVFDAVGGFRVGVSEDLEWCRRATGAGYRLVYAPEAVVGHPARRSWDELVAKWKRLNLETYALSEGRGGRSLRWLARSLLLPGSALVHTPRVLSSRVLRTWSQKRSALGVLYRLRLWRMFHAINLLAREAR